VLSLVFVLACQQSAAPAKPAGEPAKPADAAKPAATAPAKAAEAAKPAGKPQAGGMVRVGVNADFTTLDPHVSTAAVDRQVYQSVFDTLVRLDPELKLQPGLAQSWEQPDPSSIVFKLRSGITYHDGEAFNAASVKANVERMQNHPRSLRKSEVADIASVDAVDDTTVKFNLKQPSSPLLSLLTDRAGMMVSIKAAEAAGDDFARNPVGTGPFKFVEWLKDDRLVVRKFDQYWEKDRDGVQLPYLDEVTYRPIPDGNQRLTSVRTNTVDIIDFPNSKDIPTMRTSQDPKYLEIPGLAFRYIMFNTERAPFDNKAVREAVAWSLDREAINKAVFFDAGQAAQQAIPPSSWAFDGSFKPYSRDVDKAKARVAESGAQTPRFSTLVTNTPEERQLAEVYKEQLADVGLQMDIELLEFATLLERINRSDFTAVILQWSGRPDPDGNTYGYFHSKGNQNRGKYSNPRTDEALDKARVTYDQNERKTLYGEMNRLVAEDVPMVFVQHRPEIKIFTPKLQNFPHVPDGMMRFHQVWLTR